MIGITDSLIFYNFLSSFAKFRYLQSFSLSFFFLLRDLLELQSLPVENLLSFSFS